MWAFTDPAQAADMLAMISKRNPTWVVIDNEAPQLQLAGVRIAGLDLGAGMAACLFPLPLPYGATVNIPPTAACWKLSGNKPSDSVVMVVSPSHEHHILVSSLEGQGASVDESLPKRWKIRKDSSIEIRASGWAVEIVCDLSNPLHYVLGPLKTFKWEGDYPFGVKVDFPWKGVVHTTKKLWPSIRTKISEAKIRYVGDDPHAEVLQPVLVDTDLIAGWSSPAPNGHVLHQYQKDGILFCAKRGMNALVGDEMGVGKTAQAICAADAVAAPRILVICPVSARYVWDREIKGWSKGGKIQHITSQLDVLDPSARWHVVTFDQLVTRTETWRLQDREEELAFLSAFPKWRGDVSGSTFPKSVSLTDFSELKPNFADAGRAQIWEKVMRRLRAELVVQILAAGKMQVIVDEAHRAKNRDSKRTNVIQRICGSAGQVLLLTGTPLRNHEHDAAALLSLLDAEAGHALAKSKGYTAQDVKDYLSYLMIRRTKAEVLPALPPKVSTAPGSRKTCHASCSATGLKPTLSKAALRRHLKRSALRLPATKIG
jgi:hypothetical protein